MSSCTSSPSMSSCTSSPSVILYVIPVYVILYVIPVYVILYVIPVYDILYVIPVYVILYVIPIYVILYVIPVYVILYVIPVYVILYVILTLGTRASKHRPTKDAWGGEQEKEGEERRGGGHWTILGGPEYGPGSDPAESYGPQPDYENRHSEVDSAGSYDPYMDYYKGYADYGDYGECRAISLRLDLGFDYVEDPSMEVEEVLYGDPPNFSDVESVDSTPVPEPHRG
ncbi:hypothetical protein P4O66_012815 [Electrophorus voltai]|uniref:Uncharacterized protein n=1 Tax=Electrophorus voltai TaxID=2609070 RepID=A0AAD9E6E7_9TELE|nr:hypothetical protein P4O66_012815 [Electrophorus voltai]